MDRMFKKKSKKPLKLSQGYTALGFAGVAAGVLGIRTQLDIGPKGERSRSYHDLGADRPTRLRLQPRRTPELR